MIFFTDNLGIYINDEGFFRNPRPCTLKDNRTGFYFGDNKASELTVKGVSYEQITKEDILLDETKLS